MTFEKFKLKLASKPSIKSINAAVPVHTNIDGVDMKFDASVIVDVLPQRVCLEPHELRCYSISNQEPTGEARIDERASLVVSFAVPDANPISLRGMVTTGSAWTFSAFHRVALKTGVALQPH